MTQPEPDRFEAMLPALEQAVSEIRNETPDPAVVEAAAARVWARLAAAQTAPAIHQVLPHQIKGCADFQALIPEYRAGTLPAARATLLKDHLHECVACRKVYEGRIVPMPVVTRARRVAHPVRWATAAAVVAAAGLSVWIAVDQFGTRTGRAIVQTVNGTLYEVSAAGIRPLLAGQDLPDGVEFRTAKDSDAMLQLRDGSSVELRERSGLSTTQTAGDLTIHLVRGSLIVQAARRRTGHLYVATADCRVSVTGTVFGVSAGIKGSRVSVVQGEVHLSQENKQEEVLHAGEQAVTGPSLDPVSVKDDISWSRNRDRLLQQLNALRTSLQQIQMPALRYSSNLLPRLPANTVLYVAIPNLGQYLGEAQVVFRQQLDQSPELRAFWDSRARNAEPVLDKLRAASEYLGDEVAIVLAGNPGDSGPNPAPVFLAEVKRDGFPEFLRKTGLDVTIETRPGLVAFGPAPELVKGLASALDSPSSFSTTPFYARISESYREGAGILIAADLSHLAHQPLPVAGARYFIANQKQVDRRTETTAAVSFDGPRTGIAAWLSEPAPMGSLDYVSPDATFVTSFVVKNPGAIVDQVQQLVDQLPMAGNKAREDVRRQSTLDVHDDLAASLGGEFSLSLDGPPFPVPSWKLVSEVYDPERMKATLHKLVAAHDELAAKNGGKPLRTGEETVDGQTYYTIASNDPPNPLTEVHYTFSAGYMIAAPTRALLARALQIKMAGMSITHSAQFIALTPRDRHTNFSAVIYQNLGTTLAPLVGLLGALAPNAAQSAPGLDRLGNMKPTMIAAYGEPDRISIAGTGDILGNGISRLASGDLMGVVGNALPFPQFQGTTHRQPAYR